MIIMYPPVSNNIYVFTLKFAVFERYSVKELYKTKKYTMTQLHVSASDDYGHCCPPVFDPYTLVALLRGIALATYFLRIVIITDDMLMMMNRRFKRQDGYFGE